MNVPGEILEVQERQGWSDYTLLLLALEYIETLGGDFLAYLEVQADEENEECRESQK